MDVGPEQEIPLELLAGGPDAGPPELPQGGEHRHAMDFAQAQSSGRFVKDSRLGGMFHAGKVSLREDSAKGSLHVSLGQDNRVSVHIDRFSPLADHHKTRRRRGYSVRRVILHNVGIAVDYVVLFFHRRFGEQRCELECEQVCVDDHSDDVTEALDTPLEAGPVPEPGPGECP